MKTNSTDHRIGKTRAPRNGGGSLLNTLRVLAGLGVGIAAVHAQPVISSGHVDIGIGYEDGAFDLHVHQEDPPPGAEYAPGDVILRMGSKSALPGGVPPGSPYTSFFGPAGSPLWVLPKTEDPELPFLGFGTEELEVGEWAGSITLTLKGVNGPGDFFLWDTGVFGELQPKMSSRDGVSAADRLELFPGSHGHFFLGFSAPGAYEVLFEAAGTHVTEGPVLSETAGYRFEVIPEPSPLAILGLGGVALAILSRSRHRGE